ncbi:hypothetical protein HOH45_08965 [bacterium]|jgi:hypothetical protein|nr:hypothetical protein [bacterium]
MKTLNILQLKSVSQASAKERSTLKVTFSEKKLAFLKEKVRLFVDKHASITITNKNKAIKPEDGYFIFTINPNGLDLIESCSIKKYHFEFKFSENKLFLNSREADISFLDSFIRKTTTIAKNVENDTVSIIKNEVPL